MSEGYVTLASLRATGFTMLGLATVVFGVRIYSPLRHPKTFQWDDGFLIGAYFFFLVIAILYQVAASTMFRISAVEDGKIKPYPEIADEGLFIQKIFFVATSSLWFNLWCVKYSLLALYKRLMAGLRTYIMIWWGVVIFCFVVSFSTHETCSQLRLAAEHRSLLFFPRSWLAQSPRQCCPVPV